MPVLETLAGLTWLGFKSGLGSDGGLYLRGELGEEVLPADLTQVDTRTATGDGLLHPGGMEIGGSISCSR
jgi:hypothetical protein